MPFTISGEYSELNFNPHSTKELLLQWTFGSSELGNLPLITLSFSFLCQFINCPNFLSFRALHSFTFFIPFSFLSPSVRNMYFKLRFLNYFCAGFAHFLQDLAIFHEVHYFPIRKSNFIKSQLPFSTSPTKLKTQKITTARPAFG